MTRIKLIISISVFTLILASFSEADIYKHRDRNGTIHFTNIPKGAGYDRVIGEAENRSYDRYDHIIHRSSSKYNVKPSVIKAVITAESNWDPRAVSRKGAIGLMQLMPATALDMDVRNPYNPEENIEGGTRYLRYLLDRFDNDLVLALAAYNAGPSRVVKSGGIPSIKETRLYVKSVLSIQKDISKNNKFQIYKVSLGNGTTLYTNIPVK